MATISIGEITIPTIPKRVPNKVRPNIPSSGCNLIEFFRIKG